MPVQGTVKLLSLGAGDDLGTVAFGLRPQATVLKSSPAPRVKATVPKSSPAPRVNIVLTVP